MQTTTYKQTSIGLIPTDWEVKSLGNVSKVVMGQSPDSKNYFEYEIGLPLLQGNADIKERKSIKRIWTNQITKTCEKGDIVMSVRAPVGTIARASFKSCIGRGICSIQPNDFVVSDFLYSFLENYESNWSSLSQGSTFESINGDDIKLLKIPIPPLPEQQKIATILSTWDIAINNCIATLKELSRRKRWLANELLFKSHLLFKGEKSKEQSLLKLVDRIKHSFVPEPNKLYKQIGIRSHCKGIFYKEEVTGTMLGNKSVFHIEPDCFIVNIVFAWEHAIAKTTTNEIGMIASHRFPMYKPKEGLLDLNYMLHFFKSKKGKDLLELASPGGAGRNKTLGQSEFLKLQIPVPSFQRQQLIAEILDKADYEITLYQQKLEQMQQQKKGLLQQLLTGKTRVKIENE
jgi:type I restriction enzyme, S subunit